MGYPFVGEIRMFAGNFAPAGWQMCEGQLLPISENETLFQLIGTTYGGDGEETFAVPDMRGRIPIHAGSGPGGTARTLGEKGGVEEVTLTVAQLPAHSHAALASTDIAKESSPHSNVLAQSPSVRLYREEAPTDPMNVAAIEAVGASQPHTNLMPALCVSFIISLFGIFPSQA